MAGRYRIGLDIGGTFTDLVLTDDTGKDFHLHKVLTTPEDPGVGALRGLLELCANAGVGLGEVDAIIHGTTLVTNAIIERKGSRTGLLTTRGFRDILEMGKEQRYDIYDLFLRYPEPLVPRRWRAEIDERISRDGEVLAAVNVAEARDAAERLIAEGVEAIAVAFLHAYANPSHERAVRDMLRTVFPAVPVSISSEVDPEIREYERTCTTSCNAYVQPLVARYLAGLEAALGERGFRGRFSLMQSAGGTITPDSARRFPIRLLESGPAGGALVAAFFGEQLGRRDLVAFDMGGTTAKISLIRDGHPQTARGIEAARVHRFKRGSGLPVTVPVVDMTEIGAGGGSVAHVDALGLLKVGPESAGAVPGPACYGLGGSEATVTDACLVLGYFDAHSFLGGTMPLDKAAAYRALQKLGARLDLDPVATAWGLHQIVSENMAASARVYLIERGQDPRRFAMMAFGGAGPAHAVRVGRILGLSEIIVPLASGVASALGFLVSPTSFDLVHSRPGVLETLDWSGVDSLYREMEAEGSALLMEGGIGREAIRSVRRAEMRLVGQFHDIEIAVPAGALSRDVTPALARTFEQEYRRLYGTFLPGRPIQVLNWRVLVTGPQPQIRLRSESATVTPAEAALSGRRPAYFSEVGGFVEAPVYDRYRLGAGAEISGPAIVEEREATTVVGPGDHLSVGAFGHLIIRLGSQEPESMRAPGADAEPADRVTG